MTAARFGMFKQNAAVAQNSLTTALFARGITHIPNIFGAIPIQRREEEIS